MRFDTVARNADNGIAQCFELLSDKEETVCKLFDVTKLKKLYGKESLGIERSTFVLDKNGENRP